MNTLKNKNQDGINFILSAAENAVAKLKTLEPKKSVGCCPYERYAAEIISACEKGFEYAYSMLSEGCELNWAFADDADIERHRKAVDYCESLSFVEYEIACQLIFTVQLALMTVYDNSYITDYCERITIMNDKFENILSLK